MHYTVSSVFFPINAQHFFSNPIHCTICFAQWTEDKPCGTSPMRFPCAILRPRCHPLREPRGVPSLPRANLTLKSKIISLRHSMQWLTPAFCRSLWARMRACKAIITCMPPATCENAVVLLSPHPYIQLQVSARLIFLASRRTMHQQDPRRRCAVNHGPCSQTSCRFLCNQRHPAKFRPPSSPLIRRLATRPTGAHPSVILICPIS